MGEPSERDTEALRARARERIEQGRLPRVKAVRTWGGLGTGLRCDLCDAAITSSEPEFELQLDLGSTDSIRFHRLCHALWSEAREASRPSAWREVSREPPPAGTTVEARLSLGERRSIILNVVCLNGVWLNSTTGGPLPAGWCPIEWRPLGGAISGSSADPGLPGAPAGSGAGSGNAGTDEAGSAGSVPRRA